VEASPIVDLVDEDADVASRLLDWLVGLAIDLFGLRPEPEAALLARRDDPQHRAGDEAVPAESFSETSQVPSTSIIRGKTSELATTE
jgi:hypothetical protein